MPQAITKEDVVQIVGEITARGENPTVKAVRVALGNRGSFATLVPWVREAKAALTTAPLQIDNPLVRAVEALKPGIWGELLRAAKDEVAEQMAAVEQVAIERAIETDALTVERIEQDTVVEGLRTDLAATQAERTSALEALQVVTQIAAAVAAVQASVDQVASRLADVEAGIERHVADLGEQLTAKLERVQEQLSTEYVATAVRSEREREEARENVVNLIAQLTTSISSQMHPLMTAHRSSFVATQKAITRLSAATRLAAQKKKN